MNPLPASPKKILRSAIPLCAVLSLAGCDLLVSPQTRLERAQEHIAQANHRAALIELKNALQKEPDFAEARVLLAEVALWLGDAPSARIELDRIDANCQSIAEPDLCLRIDLALRRYDAVLARLAEEAAMSAADRSLYAAMAYQSLGRQEEAEEAFRAALAAEPTRVVAEVGVVETLAARNQARAALERSAEVIARHPDSALAWYARGALLAQHGEAAGAAEAFERAQQHAAAQLDVSQQGTLLAALAETKLVMRDLQGARAAVEALHKVTPGSSLARLLSARLQMVEGNYSAASAELHRIIQAVPTLTQARFMLAIALVAQGHLEQASQQLGEVIASTPANVEARQLLAQVRMRLKDPDGALQALVPALQANAGDGRLLSLMDEVTASAGIGAGGLELLERAVAQNPGNSALKLQLASAYLQSGAADRALALLRGVSGTAGDTRREALLVEALAKSRGTAAARTQVDALLAEYPGDVQIANLAASFHAGTGDLDAARRLLTQALKSSPEEPVLLSTLARVEWQAGNSAGARRALDAVLRADGGNASARMALAQIELRAGNTQAAAALLAPLRADPSAAEPRLLLARIALLDDDAKQAGQLIDEALQIGPSRADLRNAAGVLYLNTGRYDQAVDHLLAAARMAPDVPIVRLNLGRTQLGLGQVAAARESLQKALALQPGWIAAEGALAFLELQGGDGAAALGRVANLKRANPKEAAVHALDGEINYALRNYREAAEGFEAALALKPAAELAIKAYRARATGRQPDAAAPLRRWLDTHPEDVGMRNLLAEAFLAAGERRQAIEQYERILALRPQDPVTLNNLAWQYYEIKDSRALPLARKAHALAPGEMAIIDTLGWILIEEGRVEEGLPLLREAASRPGAPPDIGFHYAAALARSGASQEAAGRLRDLLAAHASFATRPAAERLLEELNRGVRGG